MSYAILNLLKFQSNYQFRNKLILNKNIMVDAKPYIFQGDFKNLQNIYFRNCHEDFFTYNLYKFLAPNMYFNNTNINNYEILYLLQLYLNKNLKSKIYIPSKKYDKFLNKLDNASRYMSGVEYDNTMQVFMLDNKYNIFNKYKKIEKIKIR